jgi:hypothetical protein
MTPTSSSSVQEQINYLVERVNVGFDRLDSRLEGLDHRMRQVEENSAASMPVVNMRITALTEKIADNKESASSHSQRLKKLEYQMIRMASMYAFFVYISSGLGVAIISLIGAILTGHAEVSFK